MGFFICNSFELEGDEFMQKNVNLLVFEIRCFVYN
jgi:hypothetical protein